MMCSQEEPTGEFLDKLIPTGSASMKNAIEKIRKPLMQMLQVGTIIDHIKRFDFLIFFSRHIPSRKIGKSRQDEARPIISQMENPKSSVHFRLAKLLNFLTCD